MSTSTSTPPPYVGYGVFKGVIDTLAQSTVPTGPLDRRVLDGVSGADHGALMSGMRFLGLVDDERRATKEYRDLVAASKAGDATYRQALLAIVGKAYSEIAGSIDVEHGTITEIEKAFKDAGVAQGQMLTKTIRFYVRALGESGIAVSPHILKAKRPQAAKKNGSDRTKPRKGKSAPRPSADDVFVGSFNSKNTQTMKTVMLPVADGSLTLSGTFNVFELVGDERTLVFAIIDLMKTFELAHQEEEP